MDWIASVGSSNVIRVIVYICVCYSVPWLPILYLHCKYARNWKRGYYGKYNMKMSILFLDKKKLANFKYRLAFLNVL